MNQINIKNLADFKKAIKVGTKLHTTWHQYKWVTGENGYCVFTELVMPLRDVSIVKTTQFAIKTLKSDGTPIDSWMQFPKSSECTFNGNSITISYETTINTNTREKKIMPFMTFKIISE